MNESKKRIVISEKLRNSLDSLDVRELSPDIKPSEPRELDDEALDNVSGGSYNPLHHELLYNSINGNGEPEFLYNGYDYCINCRRGGVATFYSVGYYTFCYECFQKLRSGS